MGEALGPLCAFGASVAWALGSTAYSKLARNYSVFAINFARAMISLPLFILTTFVVSGGFSEGLSQYSEVRVSHWLWFGLSVVSSYGLADAIFFLSTRSLGVPGALAIASAYPLWTVFAGAFFAHESLTHSQIMGLLMTIFGVVLVVLNAPSQKSGTAQVGSTWVGVVLAGITSIAWAANSFAAAKGGADLIPPVGNTLRMSISLGVTLMVSRLFQWKEALSPGSGYLGPGGASVLLPWKELQRFLGLFILEAFVGSYLFVYGMSHSPLAIGSTLTSLAPVISVPVALVLRLEKFSLFRTLGVCLAMVGICFLVGTF